MAKAKKGKSSADKAAARKAKNETLQNNYHQINNFDGIITEAMTIRNHGVLIRERSGKTVGASTFIPDVKVKKKGVNYTLVKDTEEMRAVKAEKRAANKAKKEGKEKKKK